MSNTQLLINQLQDVSTRGSLSTAYKWYILYAIRLKVWTKCYVVLSILLTLSTFERGELLYFSPSIRLSAEWQ